MDSTPLNSREMTVLSLVAWGYTKKQIANHLGCKVVMVEADEANGMRKLGLLNLVELTRHAVREGWLALDQDEELPPIDGDAE